MLDAAVLAELELLQEPNEPSFVQELLQMFVCDTAPRLERARLELAAGDLGALGRTAHQLKGSTLAIGAAAMASIVDRLELAVHDADRDRAATLVAALVESFIGTRQAIVPYL